MNRFKNFLPAFLILFGLSLKAAVTWESNYSQSTDAITLSASAFPGGITFDNNQNIIIYDGKFVTRREGTEWNDIFQPGNPDDPDTTIYGSFLKVHGGKLYFGESTYGTIYEIDLETMESRTAEKLNFNFDISFDSKGRAFVSAPSPASTMEEPRNGFFMVDFDPATQPILVAEVPGYSGPLAFDSDDNLFIATSNWGIPSEIIRFSSDTIEQIIASGASNHATEADGIIFAANIASAYDMAFGSFGLLFVTDSFNGDIQAFNRTGTAIPWATTVTGSAGSTYIDYDPENGRLAITNSDFQGFNQISVLKTDYTFIRGEINGDNRVDLADVIALLDFLFNGGFFHPNLDRLDSNDNGKIDIADAVYILNYLFQEGPPPPPPFPLAGLDETIDSLGN